MTSDTGELHQNYTDILNHPALTLLRRRDAALILTILTKAFGTSGTPVPQDRMHGLTEATLIETEGTDPTTGRPTRTGRELCDTWLTGNTRWLTRILAPNGQDEAYRMTPEAEHALAFVTELTRTHIVTTATTVETLLEAAHRCAIKASTAPTERKRLLTQRRNELTQQLNDIDTQLATIDTTPITPEPNHTVLNEYLSVHNGLETLLRDLRNISTTVRAQGDQLRHEFQTDTRETGTIIDEYLQRLSVLFSRTREGQGFESAQRLLNNPTRVNNLRNDIDTILNHPFATTLPPEHTATTRRMVNAINRGIAEVIDARNHLNTTFTRYLRSRHAPNHNLLPTRIRELEAALTTWQKNHKTHHPLPLTNPLTTTDITTLRTQPPTPKNTTHPPHPKTTTHTNTHFNPTHLRHNAGPRYREITTTINTLLTTTNTHPTAATILNTLPPDCQRPIDLLGLLTLAATHGHITNDGTTETITTTRPDGTQRTLTTDLATITTNPTQPHPTPPN